MASITYSPDEGVPVTSRLNVCHFGAQPLSNFRRAIGAAVVGHDDFTCNVRLLEGLLRLEDAGFQGLRLVQTRHDHRQLNSRRLALDHVQGRTLRLGYNRQFQRSTPPYNPGFLGNFRSAFNTTRRHKSPRILRLNPRAKGRCLLSRSQNAEAPGKHEGFGSATGNRTRV